MNRELAVAFPHVYCELDFTTPLELAVATILSAQCTDVRVNMVTPALFARYPDAKAYAEADRTELEEYIRSTGFYRNKTTSLIGLGQALLERHDGQVPNKLEDLVKLPGIGRKTANVVLGNAFDIPGITVDTHFGRLVRRWKWTEEEDAVKVEHAVGELIERKEWTLLSHRVIFPRPTGLPRAQARVRGVRSRQGLPVVRTRPDRQNRGRGPGERPRDRPSARPGRVVIADDKCWKMVSRCAVGRRGSRRGDLAARGRRHDAHVHGSVVVRVSAADVHSVVGIARSTP